MPLPEEALSSTQDCLLLTRLPLEIRHKIYEHLLLRAAPHQPSVVATIECLRQFYRAGFKHIEDYPPETVLAISRTCRQIQHESLTIYYGSNTFSFSNALYAYLYLAYIGPQRRAYVSSIQFMWAIYIGQTRGMRLCGVTDLLRQNLVDCVLLRKLHIGVAKESRDGTSMKFPPSDLFLSDATPFLMYSLRGRGDIEIKVREVFEWGRESNFEGEIKPFDDPRPTETNRKYFDVDHLRAFEKALREEAMRDKLKYPLVFEDNRTHLFLGTQANRVTQLEPTNHREISERIMRERRAIDLVRYGRLRRNGPLPGPGS